VATILFPRDEKVLAAVAFAVVFAAVGFVDDFLKVVRRRPLGLRARYKLAVQVPAAVALGLFASRGLASTVVAVPFGGPRLELGYLYLALAVGWAVFFGNAVNITDGADGLLPGAMIPSLCAYLLVALAGGHRGLAVLCSALAGACLGFLVYNRYPAQVIMGDTGSLGLGGTLTALALLTRTELLLVLVGLVYAVEALSVIMQVISFRTTGRRIFRMSPLHHHFELLGWPEGKVVKLFWLLAAVSALVGLLGLVGMGPLS
jgi:phospho-N-acetylmuramoyl-pentapeptide-transferase